MTIPELFAAIAEALGFQTPVEARQAKETLIAQLESGTLTEVTPEIRIPIIRDILDDAQRQIENVEHGSLIQLGAHVAVAQFRWDVGLREDSYDELFGDEGVLWVNPPNFPAETMEHFYELETRMRQELQK